MAVFLPSPKRRNAQQRINDFLIPKKRERVEITFTDVKPRFLLCRTLAHLIDNVGIDIGTVHMGLHGSMDRITLYMENLAVKESGESVTFQEMCNRVISNFDQRTWLTSNPQCIYSIELQPPNVDPTMIVMSYVVYMYIKMKNPTAEIRLVPAMNKYKVEGHDLDLSKYNLEDYHQRKKLSVDLIENLLEKSGQLDVLEWFREQVKGDDPADAFLLSWYSYASKSEAMRKRKIANTSTKTVQTTIPDWYKEEGLDSEVWDSFVTRKPKKKRKVTH